jgi:carbamoyltransferase
MKEINHIGISCGHHDASLSVVDSDGNILFAGHSERYSKIKNDKNLNSEVVLDALSYCTSRNLKIHYYESPVCKMVRQIYSGESFNVGNLFYENIFNKNVLNTMQQFSSKKLQIDAYDHHKSHAAAGFQTSLFNNAIVIVIDAIGEFDTATIYYAYYDIEIAKYKKLWSMKYPNSIGLFYSAMTKRVGLKPLDEEYIFMGMSAYGKSIAYDKMYNELIDDEFTFKCNLHLGVNENFLSEFSDFDIAKSSQDILETLITNILIKARHFSTRYKTTNLIYSGGVALNCVANRLLGNYFDKIWVLPNPGDAGSSLGAAALGYRKKLNWIDAFLGHNIKGNYPIHNAMKELKSNKICGIANGRAEFGPRSLGNRSLLADPRGTEIKDRVNEIKRRQKFRPFAPVILEEYVHDYFEMPKNWHNSRYMQVVGLCKFPELYPAIVHVDNTSRVQTVPKDNTGIRKLLEEWYYETGCPMLLNTSLNIKNQPIVNTIDDAIDFEKTYGIKVFM